MLWPQVLLVLLGAHSLQCSGLLDETLMAETIGEAIKLQEEQTPPIHHHKGKNHPHHHNKHHEHRKGETVCRCNHNSCVTTNYMCKTKLEAGCFFMRNKTGPSYGCVDQLTESERLTCKIHPTLTETRGYVELSCCQSDLCNYKISEGSFSSDITESLSENPPPYYDEFWIKVALIAVPVCGGLILVVLVVLACKILQRDSKYEAHLRSSSGYMQCHTDQSNANRHSKARLLLMEDGSPTSEKMVKNAIYKGPQDPKVITWVIASQQGDKPSAV